MARTRRLSSQNSSNSRPAVTALSTLVGPSVEGQDQGPAESLLPSVQETGRPVTKYTRQGIGYDTRKWLWETRAEIKAEILHLLKHATKEDQPRVTIAMKLLDKLVADANEGKGVGEGNTYNIQINQLAGRGTYRDGQRIKDEQNAARAPIEGELVDD